MYPEQQAPAPLECPQCGKKVLIQNGNFFKCLWCKFESSLDEQPASAWIIPPIIAILALLLLV